jgi:murein DD-endopeptidase MepM/ murein hydrolase activator NlpD
MEIRATCAGIEGGRFGEDARGEGNAHWGIDLLADEGTEVQVREGGVIWSKNQNDTFGRYLIIQSDDGTFTMYAHLSSRSVEGGDAVDKGDSIGETGTSGNACSSHCSCGPAHLHLEIREGGDSWSSSTPVDPEEEDRLGTEFDSDSGTAISDSCPS